MECRKSKTTIIMTVFFLSWLVCGCSVDKALDDWRACWTAVVALIVAIVCAAVLGWRDK